MALSDERKAEILEEEKLRLQARREAWSEAVQSHGYYQGGCYGGHRRWWLHRVLFWAVVVGGVVMLTRHGACFF